MSDNQPMRFKYYKISQLQEVLSADQGDRHRELSQTEKTETCIPS